jgi:hypothetical protein
VLANTPAPLGLSVWTNYGWFRILSENIAYSGVFSSGYVQSSPVTSPRTTQTVLIRYGESNDILHSLSVVKSTPKESQNISYHHIQDCGNRILQCEGIQRNSVLRNYYHGVYYAPIPSRTRVVQQNSMIVA